jgi:hypothetical protein
LSLAAVGVRTSSATQSLTEPTVLAHTKRRLFPDDGVPESSLPQLVRYLHELHPSFTVELFLRGDEAVRERVLTGEGELRREPLSDGAVYHSQTVFQLKALCEPV